MDNAADIARISGALIAAMEQAHALADAGVYGDALAELIQHARDLYVLIGEELTMAGGTVGEHAGGLYSAMGDKLHELELLLRPDVKRH